MSKPTIAVFDVGNVLIEWNRMALYRKLFDTEAEATRFLEEVCSEAWNLKFDLGVSYDENVTSLIQDYPQHEEEIRAYDTRWMEMVPDAIHESVAVLEELGENGTPLYGLTNFSAEKFALVCERFPFFGRFADIVVSADEGVIKPDPAIYHCLLDRNRLTASDTLFIDDKQENIDGARAVGMQGIRFENPEQLRADLKRVGLL